jgi:tetratricopeptide (TPR) repeat protein
MMKKCIEYLGKNSSEKEDANIFRILGHAYSFEDRVKSRSYYTQALQKYSLNSEYDQYLGEIHKNIGEYQKSTEFYEKSLKYYEQKENRIEQKEICEKLRDIYGNKLFNWKKEREFKEYYLKLQAEIYCIRNQEALLAFVKENGTHLQYADISLKNDKEIVHPSGNALIGQFCLQSFHIKYDTSTLKTVGISQISKTKFICQLLFPFSLWISLGKVFYEFLRLYACHPFFYYSSVHQ